MWVRGAVWVDSNTGLQVVSHHTTHPKIYKLKLSDWQTKKTEAIELAIDQDFEQLQIQLCRRKL